MANSSNRKAIYYNASGSKTPYKTIMNSQEVQRECLRAAQRIERAAAPELDPGSTWTDVQPGKIRAHARVNAKRRNERSLVISGSFTSYTGEKIWRNINYNNKTIDRILNVALNRCAIR